MNNTLEIISGIIPFTGIFHDSSMRILLQPGKGSIEYEKYKSDKMTEESKKISPIYNSKGKIVEGYRKGENLNLKA